MRLASPADVLWGSSSVQRPALTKRNIQKTNAYLKDSRPEQKSLVTHHTLPSLYICVWLVNTLTSTVPIGSPIICMWSPSDICEQWERNLSFGSADVSGAGTRDEPLRTSAWEATVRPHFYSAGSTFLNKLYPVLQIKKEQYIFLTYFNAGSFLVQDYEMKFRGWEDNIRALFKLYVNIITVSSDFSHTKAPLTAATFPSISLL